MEKYNLFKAVSSFREAQNGKELLARVGLEFCNVDSVVIDNSIMRKICEKDITAEAHYIECAELDYLADLPERPLAYYRQDETNLVRLANATEGCLVVYERVSTGFVDITKGAVGSAVCGLVRSAKKDIMLGDDIYPDGIIWSQQIFKAYNEKYGENILDKLALLFVCAKGSARFRGRYYKLLSELTYENFLLPIKKAVSEGLHQLCAVVSERVCVATELPRNINLAGYGCFEKMFLDTASGAITYLTVKKYTSLSRIFSFSRVAFASDALIEQNSLEEIKTEVDNLYASGIDLIAVGDKEGKDALYGVKANYIKNYCDSVAAICAQMKSKKRMLILYPTFTSLMNGDDTAFDIKLCQSLQRLDKNGIFYDICDELTFKTFAESNEGKIVIGAQEYDGVALIDAENISFATANKIQELLQQKVRFFSYGEKLRLIDGVKSARVDDLAKNFGCVKRIEDICEEKFFKLSNFELCRFGFLPDMSKLVFVRSNNNSKFSFNTRGRLSCVDVLAGTEKEISSKKILGSLFGVKTVDTNDFSSTALFIRESQDKNSLSANNSNKVIETGELFTLKNYSRNILALSLCDYRTTKGRWNTDKRMGEMSDTLLSAKGGAEFRFTVVSDGFEGKCSLYVPEFADVTALVNGNSVQGKKGVFDISGLLKNGQNEIVVAVPRIASQIDSCGMPDGIFIAGEFAALTDADITYDTDRKLYVDGGFTLAAIPEQIDINKIRESGFWYFAGAMELSCNVFVNKKGGVVYKLRFNEKNAELVEVKVNGSEAGVVGFYPYEINISDFLYDGDNEITLKLYSSDEALKIRTTQDGVQVFEPFGLGVNRTNYDFIEFDGVSRVYKCGDNTVTANDKVSFNIQRGEFVAVVGKSGAGKTTLLNILGGMDVCDSGNVVVDGRNIRNFSEAELTDYRRNDVGFVFQYGNLVDDLTVRENIELASGLCEDAISVEIALNAMDLLDYADSVVSQLSSGQQQRVAIARALAKNPKLLLCDEPTGTLDSNEGRQIISLLYETCKTTGKTAVVITHDDVVCAMADRVIKLQNGCVIENTVNPER